VRDIWDKLQNEAQDYTTENQKREAQNNYRAECENKGDAYQYFNVELARIAEAVSPVYTARRGTEAACRAVDGDNQRKR